MNIEVIPANYEYLTVVQNLARFYVYDLTEFMGWPCPESGLFGGCDEFLEDWRNDRNFPYVLRVEGELAGFAGVKRNEGVHGECFVQEFFILRKFRRKSVGRSIATWLFDKFPGRWRVQQLLQNSPAIDFWRAVIRDYTKGHYDENTERDPRWGEVNVIRFCNA